MSADQPGPSTDSARPAPRPVLYKNPQPLNAERHKGKSLRAVTSYAFAARANSVPMNGNEFPLVMHDYPIVFTPGDPITPVAVMGMRADQNLFVAPNGAWMEGRYIPAYIRRYPFIFTDLTQQQKLVLSIDEDSDLVARLPDYVARLRSDIVPAIEAWFAKLEPGELDRAQSVIATFLKEERTLIGQIPGLVTLHIVRLARRFGGSGGPGGCA